MKLKQQEKLRSLLIDAIVELCQRESFYVEELRIEGTICIVSDQTSVVVAQITEQVGEKGNIRNGRQMDESTSLMIDSEDDECSKNSSSEEKQGLCQDVVKDRFLGLKASSTVSAFDDAMSELTRPQRDDQDPDEKLADGSSDMINHSRLELEMLSLPEKNATEVDTNVRLLRSSDGKFQCPYCSKSYGFKHTLKEHLNKHLGLRPHVCRHCGDAFTHLASLCAHVKRRHDDQMPMDFQCVICMEKLMNFQSLKQHYTWRHKDTPFPEDRSMSDVPETLLRNDGSQSAGLGLEANHNYFRNSTWILDNENDEDDLIENATKKIKSELPEDSEIPNLDSSTVLESFERQDYDGLNTMLLDSLDFDYTLSKIKGNDNLDMSFASTVGSNAWDPILMDPLQQARLIEMYFEDISYQTPQGTYKYRCRFCNNMFKIRSSLYEHLNSHFGQKPYVCPHCGDRFAHHSTLHNHVHNKHSFQTSAERKASFRHSCPACGRRFRYPSELDRHFKCCPDHATASVGLDCGSLSPGTIA